MSAFWALCCPCPPLFAGIEQPVIVKSLEFLTDLWHVVVPVVDDVTDVLLLTSTAKITLI